MKYFYFFVILGFPTGCSIKKSNANYQIVEEINDSNSALQYSFINRSNSALSRIKNGDLLGKIPDNDRNKQYEKNEQNLIESEKNTVLYLPHLRTLSEEEAHAISNHANYIYLNGLERISPHIARILLKNKPHTLQLNGITELDPLVAAELSEFYSFEGSLGLNGLTSLSFEAATELGKIRKGRVLLLKLDDISKESIQILKDSEMRSKFEHPNFYWKTKL